MMSVRPCKIQDLEHYRLKLFGNLIITCANSNSMLNSQQEVDIPSMESCKKKQNKMAIRRTQSCNYDNHIPTNQELDKRRASALVDELLLEIYNTVHNGTTDYFSTSGKSQKSIWIDVVDLQEKDGAKLSAIVQCLREHVAHTGSVLVRQLKRRDALRRQQQAHCDVISRILTQRASVPVNIRFTIQPPMLEGMAFTQWTSAMKMVAQLPGGIPPEFRRHLWISMAERYLSSRGVDWFQVEKTCFSEWSNPTDAELGIQIVKDLHRTGCNLFCGDDSQHNQALLKKVLLGYARWNKTIGYCQGFNMLAALILQVTDKCESDALKLMIYLIEGVLPDSYFGESLRGLSVDMAIFRELLKSKLPKLSKHLDMLQNASNDNVISYEPPLINVFTMQWFLTIFCNCLAHFTVLRVWDLIFLEGNEFLLRTALAIWKILAQKLLLVRTADEFYCLMETLTNELLESIVIDADTLIKAIIAIGPIVDLKNLREHYLYNIRPWGTFESADRAIKVNRLPKEDKISLDISALKKQYLKLKQRQKQSHIIFSAAVNKISPASVAPVAMNHLLVGKSALSPSRRPGPLKGSIPPARNKQLVKQRTMQWKDVAKEKNSLSSPSSSDTELCDDENLQNQTSNVEVEDNIDGENPIVTVTEDKNLDKSSYISNANLDSENQDKNDVEFEKFLIDRINSDKFATRRNSELALQIIQGNSQILQRIMEGQSRCSPLVGNESLLFGENNLHKSKMDFDLWLQSSFINLEENGSIEINNFLTDDLDNNKPEKSGLCYNLDIKNEESSDFITINKCSDTKNNDENDSALNIQDMPQVTSVVNNLIDLNDNEDYSFHTALTCHKDENFYGCNNFKTSSFKSKSSFNLDSQTVNSDDSKIETLPSSSDIMMNGHVVFNPFPIVRNLKQKKEITLKLGLYKK